MDETTDGTQNDASRLVQRQAINQDNAARAGRPTVQDQIEAIKFEKSEWTSQNISAPENNVPGSNATTPDEARGDFPFDQPGSFTLNMKSEHTKEDRVKFVDGFIRLQNEERGDFGVLMVAEGVHFVNNGTLYMTAVPERRPMPSEDLLHMLPSNSSMNQAREVLQEQLSRRMEELEELLDWAGQGSIDNDHSNMPAADCAFEFWMQLHPVNRSMSEVLDYEKELENPQGITVRSPGPLVASMVMYSANCGIVLEMDDSHGIKIEKYYKKAISYATLASILTFIQIFLLIHQMEYTPTPSSVSNVSYWTIAMQSTMDGYLCLIHLTTGVVVQSVFIPFATTAFFTFVLVSIFGMRYLMVIWRIQRPEVDHREQTAASQQTRIGSTPVGGESNESTTHDAAARNTSALGGILPIANTTARPAVRTTQDERREDALLYYRFYYYACPHNILAHKPTKWVWVLAAYVMLQVIVLMVQDIWDPRFFVPERYLPERYNYHPILPSEDEETNVDIKVVGVNASEEAESSDVQPMHAPGRDCAICMLPVNATTQGHTGLHALGRANYMVTPCHHLFHTECLEKWMRIKLECPVCRAYLPAV
ncbi:unnamed protein product [Umbelopsis vinacea]